MLTDLPLIFDTWPQLLITCLVMVTAQTIYVLFGFGAGMIAVGTLAMLLPDLQDVVVLMLLVTSPAELLVVLADRKKIMWRGVLLVAIGVGIGIPTGTVILRLAEPTFMLTGLGIFLVVAGGAFIRLPRQPTQRARSWPAWTGPSVGIVSGLLTGLYGTGGPPLIFYYQLAGVDKTVFRGNLMAIFLLMTLFRLPSYAVAGFLTPERLWSALVLMPAVLAGVWLGNRIHLQLEEQTFRRLVSIALVIIGLLLLSRQLL